MDRVRGARPRPRRLRQGRDRPGHPDRAHPDRRRRARRAAGAGQSRFRPDRHQPGRRLHLGQLFDRGRRRLDPPGLRRGALAVPRPRRRDAALPGRRTLDRGRQVPARRQGHRPRLLVGGGRDRRSIAAPAAPRRSSGRRPTRSSASICRGSTCPPRSRARASSTTSRPTNVLHARVLRQPWRGAHLVALDENAVRKAAKAPIDILREGEFVAFTAGSELAVMRASEAARTLAKWEGGTPPPADVGTPAWLKAQASRDKTTDTGEPGRAPAGRVVEASYSRPVPHLWLDRHVLRARRVQGRRAQGVVALAGPGGAARMARPRARPAGRAGQRVPPPGRRRLRPQHRRRRRLRCVLHRHAPSGPHRPRAVVARGRVRRRSDQHRDGDHASRRARRRQQARRLADRNLEPAARPASRHERQFQSARRRGAAQRAAAQPARATCPTSAAAAPPATQSRSTICRATG